MAEASRNLTEVELQIFDKISKLESHYEVICNNLEHINRSQQKLLDAVYGNGKEGLKTRVTKIEVKNSALIKVVTILGGVLFGIASYVIQRNLT